MNFFYAFVLVCFFSSCSNVGLEYLAEQGLGQARLQLNGISNEEILASKELPPDLKRKILLIGDYKKYFYQYFNQNPSSIYSKTTLLESEAVSYLVIASPHNKIEPYQFKFPLLGEFPYIGFFQKDSALEFARKITEEKHLVTWVRPVFAYSTLGFFEDRILSSFLKFDEVELAELIFHELFHTVFFVKNEVDLNENLANYFSKQLLKEYFKDQPDLDRFFETEQKINLRNQKIVELISILSLEFEKMGVFLTPQRADEITFRFVEDVFYPEVARYCKEIKLDDENCQISQSWNQAAFAAFLTYEKDQNLIELFHSKSNLSLKDFLPWLIKEYHVYSNSKNEDSFHDFLKNKVSQ
jgi:predicted aminopeptidase